jgi:hypothetical protein
MNVCLGNCPRCPLLGHLPKLYIDLNSSKRALLCCREYRNSSRQIGER